MGEIALSNSIKSVNYNASSCRKVMFNGVKVWEWEEPEYTTWDDVPYEDYDCLTFESEGVSSVTFNIRSTANLEYSYDKSSWSSVTNGFYTTVYPARKLYLRGINKSQMYIDDSVISISNTPVSIYGNITALVDYTKDPRDVFVQRFVLGYLFKGSSIKKLPTMVMQGAFDGAFYYYAKDCPCTGRLTLGIKYAYSDSLWNSFWGSGISSVNIVCENASSVAFSNMFLECESITYASVYMCNAEFESYASVFKKSSIESAKLVANGGTVEDRAFSSTFNGCSSFVALTCNCDNISTFMSILNGVSETGVLTIPTGVDPPTMPAGWTIQYM